MLCDRRTRGTQQIGTVEEKLKDSEDPLNKFREIELSSQRRGYMCAALCVRLPYQRSRAFAPGRRQQYATGTT